VQPIDAVTTTLPTDGRSDYPVKPSHRLQLDLSEGPHKSSTLIAYVARDAGQWREVLPCPRGDVLRQAEVNQAAEAREAARVKSLLTSMAPDLRSELQAMLAEGPKVDAIRRYAAASKEDLSIAKTVVESLAAPGPRAP
jgi:hypothetical protein